METSMKLQENQNPSLVSSPNSNSTNSSSSSNTTHQKSMTHPCTPRAPAPPPVIRSEPNNPNPTTFVQADSSSFKQVVQMLTGSSDTAKIAANASTRPDPIKNPIPVVKTGSKKEKASKLYERRNSMKNFKISPLIPGLVNGYSGSPRKPSPAEILSPSMLNFPSLVLSPVTPLIPDPFNRSQQNGLGPNINMDAENKAIAHKGFYLHPSPSNTPRGSEPRLLPLFPVTSPRASGLMENVSGGVKLSGKE
ncbi:hypothetical protein ACET3Z_003821 [Daucus carota]